MDHLSETTRNLHLLARAERATAGKDWDEAARRWADVVAINPITGRFWSCLAEAQYQTGNVRGAIDAAEQAFALGDNFPAETAYRLATYYVRLREYAPAQSWFDRAWDLGYRHSDRARDDDELGALREDDGFRARVGLMGEQTLSRDQGWQFDLQFLAQEIKRRAFAPFRRQSEATFDETVADLHRAIPTLSDAEIVVALRKLLVPLGDGHAGIRVPKDRDDLQAAVPLQFSFFAEGLYVIAADERYADLLGVEVLTIGDRPVAAALAAVTPLICRDNEHWISRIAPQRLRELSTLHALGVIPNAKALPLTVRDVNGETRSVSVAADPSQQNWQLPESAPYPAHWRFFPETLAAPLPLYLRYPDVAYWFTYLAEERTVYFQFNSVRDDQREPIDVFCARLFAFIAAHPVEKLVIDIRWNGGGNTLLEKPIFTHLIRAQGINQRGSLFVIIGRRTFSAAQNFANFLETYTEAIFVGEPTGSSPVFIGETVEFTLPYSKIVANVSDLYWASTWPGDYRTWIAPLLYTPPTFAMYRENRDPALEAILELDAHLPGW